MNGWNGDNVVYVGEEKMMMINPCAPLPIVVGTATAFDFSSNSSLVREVNVGSLTLVSHLYSRYISR